MVKQKGRNSKPGKKSLVLPDEEEGTIICTVQRIIGAGFVEVLCADRQQYKAWIPGRMRRRVWLYEGDIILFLPWGTSDMKGEVVHKYRHDEIKVLMQKGLIPEDLLGEEGE
ncbi:MAG: translation initiation factor IF-1A [Caldisphaeraceae archaeon]|nr:translation initiation factor IF-1A [Caldisphaeraceae archaeon]MEB3692591.1 translation initiation factor IF-1A [Caldisphaeraceae archaeon]MEB3797512.1 translation initiation factor IF-1A [Caldisphaeraceae archaeon]